MLFCEACHGVTDSKGVRDISGGIPGGIRSHVRKEEVDAGFMGCVRVLKARKQHVDKICGGRREKVSLEDVDAGDGHHAEEVDSDDNREGRVRSWRRWLRFCLWRRKLVAPRAPSLQLRTLRQTIQLHVRRLVLAWM